jgi:hypothetical protein
MKKITTVVFLCAIAIMSSCSKDESGYAITITNDNNGIVSVSVNGITTMKAKEGETVTLTATLVEGYEFKQWTVIKGNIVFDDETANPIVFKMPIGDVEIQPEFTVKPAVKSDYYGAWVDSDNSTDWWEKVILSENKLTLDNSGGHGFAFENLTWTAITNTYGSHIADYPTGFRITGTLVSRGVYSPRLADGSGHTANIGDIAVTWLYIHNNKSSLIDGSWGTDFHEACGRQYIKQP